MEMEFEPEPEETTEPEPEETEKDDDGGDSGIIIIFSDLDDVHAALEKFLAIFSLLSF